MEVKTYEYVILVDNEPVARGKNLKKMIEEVEKKHPKKKIAIRYEYPPGILIAIIRL